MKLIYFFVAGAILSLLSCSSPQEKTGLSDQQISAEISGVLNQKMLAIWYPKTIDSVYGGFLSDFNYKWEMSGPQNKMIVTQSRHVWTTATAAEFYPERKDYFLKMAAHGAQFLQEKMWDHQLGGFYNLVNQEGEVIAGRETGRIMKDAYGNAFAIYGLATYSRVSGDTTALKLAKKAFYWLDEHSYDPVYGGYFQFMEADGTPLKDGYNGTPPKDQNSSIHLLEALTELYRVWPDSLVRERLLMMLSLIRDKITHPKGYLQLFENRDLSPVSYRDSTDESRKKHWNFDHISYGHDVETAFLMLEASEVAGLENDTVTLQKAKLMVDHALKSGWDKQVGGFYDAGYYFKGQDTVTIIRDTKNWWAQAEGLNTLLMMSQLFPDDPHDYKAQFRQQWEYIKKYLLDPEYGDWYSEGIDKAPEAKKAMKAQIWKGNYHTTRSLINCLNRLKKAEG